MSFLEAPVTPFRANLAGKLRGTIFVARSSPPKVRACKYFTQISSGPARKCSRKSHLPTDRFWACSKFCPQTGFEHAQNFVRVSCGYLHANVIAKHQQEARKCRNLLACNPLKQSRLAVDLWPSRTSACFLRSYCELCTDKKRSLYYQLACVRSFLLT